MSFINDKHTTFCFSFPSHFVEACNVCMYNANLSNNNPSYMLNSFHPFCVQFSFIHSLFFFSTVYFSLSLGWNHDSFFLWFLNIYCCLSMMFSNHLHTDFHNHLFFIIQIWIKVERVIYRINFPIFLSFHYYSSRKKKWERMKHKKNYGRSRF
jgi:hypothetical protein